MPVPSHFGIAVLTHAGPRPRLISGLIALCLEGNETLRCVATRLALVAVLIAGLLNLSVMAAAGNPLGMVVNAQNAHLGDANAAMGTNLFSGDSLQTDPGGSLRVRVGANQIYLTSASFATLLQDRAATRLKLDRGTLGFSSSTADRLEIQTPIGLIRPANDKAAFAEVTIVGPTKILVAAYRGSIVVSNAGFERTIPEGAAFNVALAQGQDAGAARPDDNDGNDGNYDQHRRAFHDYAPLIFTAVVAGALAGLGYLVWHLADESSPNPPPR
jgi:hypothetical protein